MKAKELTDLARAAMKNAYAPYSEYTVGAALLCSDGRVYTGCNIENAAYTPTVCAERVAVFKAVSDGVREFCAIAVAGGKNGTVSGAFPPCGVCRQVLAEFCRPDDMKIYLATETGHEEYTLAELLPRGFFPFETERQG